MRDEPEAAHGCFEDYDPEIGTPPWWPLALAVGIVWTVIAAIIFSL